MAAVESRQIDFVPYEETSSQQNRFDYFSPCMVCNHLDWSSNNFHYSCVYQGRHQEDDYYAHKGCVTICIIFNLTINNIKLISSSINSKNIRNAQIISIMKTLSYLPNIATNSLKSQNLKAKIQQENPESFSDFLQAVQNIYNRIIRIQQGHDAMDDDSTPSTSSAIESDEDIPDEVGLTSFFSSLPSSTNDSATIDDSDDDSNFNDDFSDLNDI